MAIKDLIGPGFVGTNTIKWIITRGLTPGTAPTAPDVEGIEYKARPEFLHYKPRPEAMDFKPRNN